MTNRTTPKQIVELLEPEAGAGSVCYNVTSLSISDKIALSQAISLKRIADVLEVSSSYYIGGKDCALKLLEDHVKRDGQKDTKNG